MPEEKKQTVKILLESLPDEKYSVKQIHDFVKPLMSYPTLLKWITVLEAEGFVKIEDYGNIKLVQFKRGNNATRPNEPR
jgi:DNA-binding transcriptional ArsR family regulator